MSFSLNRSAFRMTRGAPSLRISCNASRAPLPARPKSSTRTCGRCLRTARTVSSPVLQQASTVNPGSDRKSRSMPSKRIGYESASTSPMLSVARGDLGTLSMQVVAASSLFILNSIHSGRTRTLNARKVPLHCMKSQCLAHLHEVNVLQLRQDLMSLTHATIS